MIILSKLITAQVGRPRKSELAVRETMSYRNIKLPDTCWEAFDNLCKELGLSEHEAMRIAVLQFTYPQDKYPELYS